MLSGIIENQNSDFIMTAYTLVHNTDHGGAIQPVNSQHVRPDLRNAVSDSEAVRKFCAVRQHAYCTCANNKLVTL